MTRRRLVIREDQFQALLKGGAISTVGVDEIALDWQIGWLKLIRLICDTVGPPPPPPDATHPNPPDPPQAREILAGEPATGAEARMSELVLVHRWPGNRVMIEPAHPGESRLQSADCRLLQALGADREAWFNAEAPAHDDSDWLIGERVGVPIRIVRVVAAGGGVVAAVLALWVVLAGLCYLLHLAIWALRHAG
jgi:hypothetical protein